MFREQTLLKERWDATMNNDGIPYIQIGSLKKYYKSCFCI